MKPRANLAGPGDGRAVRAVAPRWPHQPSPQQQSHLDFVTPRHPHDTRKVVDFFRKSLRSYTSTRRAMFSACFQVFESIFFLLDTIAVAWEQRPAIDGDARHSSKPYCTSLLLPTRSRSAGLWCLEHSRPCTTRENRHGLYVGRKVSV